MIVSGSLPLGLVLFSSEVSLLSDSKAVVSGLSKSGELQDIEKTVIFCCFTVANQPNHEKKGLRA